MEKTLPKFPSMPDPGYEYMDENGKWKDCSFDWIITEGLSEHEYRRKNPTNETMRDYAHKIVDYFVDIAEMGEVGGLIENRALLIYVNKMGQIEFAIVEPKEKSE